MSKYLRHNLTSQYLEAAQRMSPRKKRRRIVAYVESYDDICFWRTILSHYEDETRYFEIMLPSTKTLQHGKKTVLMSSLSSYGMGDEKTFRPIHSGDPQHPNTAYGKSKLKAEKYLRRQTYFPYVILCPTGVYGPGEKDYFMQIKSVNSGFDFTVGCTPQRITFIYVKDLARAAFLALENEAAHNRHYFVADGDVYTDEAFGRLIQELLGKKHVLHARIPLCLVHVVCLISEWIGKLLRKGMTLNTDKYIILKQRNWICDVAPIQNEIGFKAEYPLRRGLKESIEWYKKEGWL